MSKTTQDFLNNRYNNDKLDDNKKRFVNECKGPMSIKEDEGEPPASSGGIASGISKHIGSFLGVGAKAAGKAGMGSEFAGEVGKGYAAIKSGRLSRPWGMPAGEEIPESVNIEEQEDEESKV